MRRLGPRLWPRGKIGLRWVCPTGTTTGGTNPPETIKLDGLHLAVQSALRWDEPTGGEIAQLLNLRLRVKRGQL